MVGEFVHSEKRADIEGLRAVAVCLVLLYHLRVQPFGGGYVGVDAFFVVSGFLITGLMLREKAQTGAVNLREFWARRLRRIMPMALVVAVLTVILGYRLLEPGRTDELMPVALGAVGFCANIVLFYRTDDYLGGVTLPSPLQHYWSLGVEEQFYLVWPLVVWGVARLGRTHWRRWLALVCGVGLGLSLFESVRVSYADHGAGYFLPQTRVWEILVGAALALAAAHLTRVPRWLAGLAGWGGLALIVGAAVVFDEETVFPGHLALVPVLGAALVIVAADSPWGPHRVLRVAPLQYLGLWSFSLYLVHFPMIVLVEAWLGELSWLGKIVVTAVCVALSAATFRLVERPIRWHPWLAVRPWRTLVAGFAALALVLSAGVTVQAVRAPADDGAATFAVPSGLDPTPSAQSGASGAVEGILMAGITGVADAVGTVWSDAPADSTADSTDSAKPAPAPKPVKALLLGDSTLAGLRWYEQGQASVAGFQYVLDAEACRRLAYQGCEGREGRTPASAKVVVQRLTEPFDVIVVQAGYHGRAPTFHDEMKAFVDAANATGARVVILTLKESLRFPALGTNGTKSMYTRFNEIIREMQAAGELGDAIVADWNLFSYPHPEWFRPDGIHTTITGALALGWFISMMIAATVDNPCPYDGSYPCVVPHTADPNMDLLTMFGVAYTDIHCYEDVQRRVRRCEPDRRMS